jgi:ubiquinone/menaquinone biosynthesis C-methylase UbiE
MAQFHFVEDYQRLVTNLVAAYPLDQAMNLAVGGGDTGPIHLEILKFEGLKPGMTLLDLGCGGGRTAVTAAEQMQIDYIGVDIVQELLDYAKSRSPENYLFINHQALSIPLPDDSVDMICSFSLFTHLLHTETYLYIEECKRVLRPGGRLVFSFLEFGMPFHWNVFAAAVEHQRNSMGQPIDQFIELSAIKVWCEHLGLKCEYIEGHHNPWGTTPALGQSIAVLSKDT